MSRLLLKLEKFFINNLQDYTKFSIQHKMPTSIEKEIPSKWNTYFTTDWINQYKRCKKQNEKKIIEKCYKPSTCIVPYSIHGRLNLHFLSDYIKRDEQKYTCRLCAIHVKGKSWPNITIYNLC